MKSLVFALAFFSFLCGCWLASAVYAYALGASTPAASSLVFTIVDLGIVGFLLRAILKKNKH